jgi:hypothetical protein
VTARGEKLDVPPSKLGPSALAVGYVEALVVIDRVQDVRYLRHVFDENPLRPGFVDYPQQFAQHF